MKFIDTHAHLQDPRLLGQLDKVLNQADRVGIKKIMVVGYDLQSSQMAVNLSNHSHLYAAVGIHPHDAGKWNDDSYQKLKILTQQQKVVAIGEIGMDFYYQLSEPAIQKNIFQYQIDLAVELNYPLIVHSRKSMVDVLEILKQYQYDKVLLHSFEGNIEQAHQAVDRNYFLSFNGITTFKNSDRMEILRNIGLENIMLETDCPYLAPVPLRGKLNQPSYLPYINQFIADQLGKDPQFTADKFYRNSLNFFNIDE